MNAFLRGKAARESRAGSSHAWMARLNVPQSPARRNASTEKRERFEGVFGTEVNVAHAGWERAVSSITRSKGPSLSLISGIRA